MTQTVNRYWWEDFYKNCKKSTSNVCRVRSITLEKKKKHYFCPLPSGPFGHLQLDFIQLTVLVIKNVPVTVYTFSRCVKIFLCYKSDALIMARKMEKTYFPLGVYQPQSTVMKTCTLLGKSYEP